MKLKLVGEGYRSYLADETGEPIGSMPDSTWEDIARRFNSHDALVAALLDIVDICDGRISSDSEAWAEVDRLARKALPPDSSYPSKKNWMGGRGVTE